MEFRVLGPLEVRANGRVIPVRAPQLQLVLAILASEAGRPVTAEELIDRMWTAAPDGARSTVHVYISRIRRLLRHAGATDASLVRSSDGYLLDIDPDGVDVRRFHRLLRQAGEPDRADGGRVGDGWSDGARVGGGPANGGWADEGRVAMLREAVGLWHGEPLAGLGGPWAAQAREALRRTYLDAVVDWARMELSGGGPALVIALLTALAAEYPLVETLVATTMRALGAVGRADAALEFYARTRARLVAELGVDPGVELSAARAAIRGDATGVVPAQLPADVPGFVGRTDELARLTALSDVDHGWIATIDGTAGVGKTALAVHWAHRATDRFPDGQLYVNLRGFDPAGAAVAPDEALRGFLEALGVPPHQVPAELDQRAALYRNRLTGRRVLVVLDNARDAEQIQPLLPGSPGCVVVVTSRHRLSGVDAIPITVNTLPAADAHRLLMRRVGVARLAAEPDAANRLVDRSAGLPLALAIVAARVAAQPRFALADVLAEFTDTQDGLDAWDGGEAVTDLRSVFSWSLDPLSAAAVRMFRLLGVHPGPDITVPAAASLAGVPRWQADAALTELARAHLLTAPRPGRFAFHDLLRAYATELATDNATVDDAAVGNVAARRRMLGHYVHTGHAAARLLDPHRLPIPLRPPDPAVRPEELSSGADAVAWFTAEHPVLRAAIHDAARHGLDADAWQLAAAHVEFYARRGSWGTFVDTQRIGLAAADRAGDLAGQAHAQHGLGRAYAKLGKHDEALRHYEGGRQRFQALGNRIGEALAHKGIAWVLGLRDEYREALRHAGRALELFRATGHRAGEANTLNAMGWYHAQLGDHERALVLCGQALESHATLGDRHGAANTWDSLGYAHHQLGRHREAAGCYQRAVELYQAAGDRHSEAQTLRRLGDSHAAAGDASAARRARDEATRILTMIRASL
ncbi:tetratricopeptide repeat protein [Actinomycetes bacterium KLBMP 9797]